MLLTISPEQVVPVIKHQWPTGNFYVTSLTLSLFGRVQGVGVFYTVVQLLQKQLVMSKVNLSQQHNVQMAQPDLLSTEKKKKISQEEIPLHFYTCKIILLTSLLLAVAVKLITSQSLSCGFDTQTCMSHWPKKVPARLMLFENVSFVFVVFCFSLLNTIFFWNANLFNMFKWKGHV